MSQVECPKCRQIFKPTPVAATACMAAGAATGAFFGGGVGLVAGPLGGVAGTVPGAIVGGVVGLLGGSKFAKCPACSKVFKRG